MEQAIASGPRPGSAPKESVAPAAPSPNARPEPAPPAKPGSYRSAAFDEIDQIDTASPAPHSTRPKNQPPAPEKKEEPPKPAAAKPDAPAKPDTAPKPDAKPDPKAPETTITGPSAKFQQAKELRSAYDSQVAENKALKAEIEKIRTTPPKEAVELKTENQTLKKRLDELEQEIRYHDYTKSSEYKDKFEKPFTSKLADVYENVQELTVTTPEGERAATPADFDRILQAPQEDVRRLAREMFGDDNFREVLQYRRELAGIRKTAENEIKRYRDEAKTREQTRESESSKAREEANNVFQRSQQAYVEKYPQWFAQVEGDDELNEALTKGFQSVDKAFDKNLPMEARADLLAANRLKAASFGRHVITIKRLNSKIAELENELKEFRESTPGEGDGGRKDVNGNGRPSVDEEIDRLERESEGR